MKIRRFIAGLVTMGLATLSSEGYADTATCLSAHTEGQKQRQSGKLRASFAQFEICAAVSCPARVRDDCVKWISQVETSLPSVVVTARDASGNPITTAKLHIDGELRTETLDGRALVVDPGMRRFVLSQASGISTETTLVVEEGRRNQPVTMVMLGKVSTSDAGASSPGRDSGANVTETREPFPTVPVVLGAVGLASLASFAYFGISGKVEEKSLRDTCAPYCTESQKSALLGRYIAADVSAAVGLVSFGLAAYFFFTRQVPSKTGLGPIEFHIGSLSGGGQLDLRGRF